MGFMRGMAVVAAALAVTPALAANKDADFLKFLAGDYIIIGRAPDGGAVYSGRATIEVSSGGVLLHTYRGDTKIEATGGLDVASPGEERVLRFYSGKPDATDMTCLVSTDLDNYARLTCVWWQPGTEPKHPGLEAKFPTAEWPEPGK